MTDTPMCPLSQIPMTEAFVARLLKKYDVTYFCCSHCGLLQTEKPYWLDEAYETPIFDADTGLLARNISNSLVTAGVVACLSLGDGHIVDVAGGYGLLTRLLRDKGLDCYTTDKYCQNIFAKTYEPAAGLSAKLLLAFEVLEHIANPFQFVSEEFAKYNCSTILFSTLTYGDQLPPSNWWYYARDGGQHITFYQTQTLSLLANRVGCKYYQLSPNLHLISAQKIPVLARLVLGNRYLRHLHALYVFARSKIGALVRGAVTH